MKKSVYDRIDKCFGGVPVDVDRMLRELNATCVDLTLSKRWGGLLLGRDGKHIIGIRKDRNYYANRFTACHEAAHLVLGHRPSGTIFSNFEEWQANVAASQMLLPYQELIPFFAENYWRLYLEKNKVISEIVIKYMVTPPIARQRYDDLSYEISQYRAGVPMEKIVFLTHSEARRRGIVTGRFRDFPFDQGSGGYITPDIFAER